MKKVLSFLFVLILLVIGATVVFGQLKETFSFNFSTSPIEQEETVSGSEAENIEIRATSADIKVVSVEREDIYAKLSGDVSEKNKGKYKLIVKEVDGTIQIEVEQPNMEFQIGTNITSLKVEIEVPEKTYTELSTISTSSDIQMSGLQVNSLRTEVTSGDIMVENITIKDSYFIELTSGDVRIENTEAKNITIEGTSGDITFKEVLADLQVDTTSGDINVWGVEGNVDVETTSGDIEIDNKRVTGNLEVEVTSGDVSVKFDENPSSLAVDFKGRSGKGTVNLDGMQYKEKSERNIEGQIGDGEFLLKVRTTSGDFRLN
ncbi:DUF4097 family beta strand repeat-containing protein [Sutcliffiella horikoshii]|uniref:DUF4097 domain-containing protein n=1 Tax=Sutcliffiella horikoshii TaxID=79883 RepID=A0A1Y0CJJ5_9BACI|nr:DUF4097 family beta strand repeat-containing protein [Sutcliffiella horikoshii]ART75362.1 hypothetical protein B4U37_04595 [Sutcliffiella horikoshii]TYS58738.1 DUF4097 domain-containing protein [Sutcliffiella horikoshii]